MAKPKIRFVCQSCGYVTAKWLGKCPECGQWDSFVEEMDVPERPGPVSYTHLRAHET